MRTLLVATPGGHLTQLALLKDRLDPPVTDAIWVTGTHPQAAALVAGDRVIEGHLPDTRSLPNAWRNWRLAARTLDEHRIDRVVSTGAGIAVPFLVEAARRGIPAHYIESATRVHVPSLSGRILERVPGVTCYAQYPWWVREGWLHAGSLLDSFAPSRAEPTDVHRIFVTLGTQHHRFDALVDRVAGLLEPDDEVVWQLGASMREGLPGRAVVSMGLEDLEDEVRRADVVVSHAGTGSVLTMLRHGRVPVLVPRRSSRGEHVDDHQALTSRETQARDLAVVSEVELLDRSHLEAAASRRVATSAAEPFPLFDPDSSAAGDGPVGPLRTPARWRQRMTRWLVTIDAAVIAGSSLGAFAIRQQLGESGVVRRFDAELPLALAVLPLWLGVLLVSGAYRPEYINSGGEGLRRFTIGTMGGIVGLAFVSFLLELRVSRLYVLLLTAFVMAGGGVARLVLRSWIRRRRRRGQLHQRVLLVGGGRDAALVSAALGQADVNGYRVVGMVTDEVPVGDPDPDAVPCLGTVAEAIPVAYRERAGLLVVSPGGVAPQQLQDLMTALADTPIDLAVSPSLLDVVSRRMVIESVGGAPLLHVDQISITGWRAFAKRLLDLVVAVVLGVLFAPIALLSALAVKLESPRAPVLFRQVRIGKDGVPFRIVKFRTMVPDAEELLVGLRHLNEVGHGFFKVREDPRVTRVGRVLRKWSIDEVPQLLNVLVGDMSMVGPRPPLAEEVAEYEPWQRRRLRVRPGITGIWQTSGRSEVPFDEAVRMDLFYIANWSFGSDIYLLAKTVPAVLGRSGAH